MKTKTRAAIAALLVLALPALAACGSSTTKTAGANVGPGNPVDRAFVAEMVPHHRSAVAMARIAKDEARTPFVKTLAANVTRTQNREIAQMQRVDRRLADVDVRKGDLGMDDHMTGQDMDPDMLRGARPFDARFIAMMVPHHEGAIAMAKVELTRGENPELKALARSIIAAQRREVRQMRDRLKGSRGGAMDETHSGGHHG